MEQKKKEYKPLAVGEKYIVIEERTPYFKGENGEWRPGLTQKRLFINTKKAPQQQQQIQTDI